MALAAAAVASTALLAGRVGGGGGRGVRCALTAAPVDGLFLSLAPAWAYRRPYTSASTPSPAHVEQLRKEQRDNDGAWPESSDSTSLRQQRSSSKVPDGRDSRRWNEHARVKSGSRGSSTIKRTNNYLLALARAYRTPPPAYVFEAVRLLRDLCVREWRAQSYGRSRDIPPGYDRMTLEIILDLLARAIPLHTELGLVLTAERRRRYQHWRQLAFAGKLDPGVIASEEDALFRTFKRPQDDMPYQYGVSRRLAVFAERVADGRVSVDDVPPHFQLGAFIAILTEWLERGKHSVFKDRKHFFLQDKERIQAAVDAEEAMFHPVPSRMSARKRKRQKAAAAGREVEDDSDAGQAEMSLSETASSKDLKAVAASIARKAPAQVFLKMFENIYHFMLDRSRERPESRRETMRHWFERQPSGSSKLLRSGVLGPRGPSTYGYAARLRCYARVRYWDEVRATIRECVGRAYWEPPWLEPRHTAIRAPPSTHDETGMRALPRGWTPDEALAAIQGARDRERSMLNMALLSETLWAWVRIQAPSAPYTVPPEDWEGSGDEPDAAALPGEDQATADVKLPDASTLPTQSAADAIKETVGRLRDVYDMLRDNAMLEESNRIRQDGVDESSSTSRNIPNNTGWLAGSQFAIEDSVVPSLERDLAQLAQKNPAWSKDKLWLEQMRILLRWDKEKMEDARRQFLEGRQAIQPPTKSDPTPADETDEMSEAEEEEEAEELVEVNHRSLAKASPYSRTLRVIFGLPTHPAVQPPIPAHIIPDVISYTQFIRLFTHLGDWEQAVEVLADYEQTPLQSSSAKDDGLDGDVDGTEDSYAGMRTRHEHEHNQRVINEVTLPMFDAFFRGYCRHAIPPMPNNIERVHAALGAAQRRVAEVLRALGLDDGAEEGDAGAKRIPEILNVSQLLSGISEHGRGWTLESLLFMFEAYLRLRPDAGPDSVRRRMMAREMAYRRHVEERRRREAARYSGVGYGLADAELPHDVAGASPYEYEGASPTPFGSRRPQIPAFFDRAPLDLPGMVAGRSDLSARPVDDPHRYDGHDEARQDDVDDESWISPVGSSLLDNIWGPAPSEHGHQAGAPRPTRLESSLPDRFFGGTPRVLEVDSHGHVRGFHPAPVPRQLFWVLTALRRATSDHAPGWVLEQWSRVLAKFGPDAEVYDRLWEEHRRHEARRWRRINMRPEEDDDEPGLGVDGRGGDDDGEPGQVANSRGSETDQDVDTDGNGDPYDDLAPGERPTFLFGTGREGSYRDDGAERTDANAEGWYAWKFPQRRTNRVIQYLALRAGQPPDSVRYG